MASRKRENIELELSKYSIDQTGKKVKTENPASITVNYSKPWRGWAPKQIINLDNGLVFQSFAILCQFLEIDGMDAKIFKSALLGKTDNDTPYEFLD